MIYQYPSRHYLLQYIRHNLYLYCHLIYRSYHIGNCVSEYYERVEESNYKSLDNYSDTRLSNINQLRMNSIINPLSIDFNILALVLILISDIWQIDIRNKNTYIVDIAHRARFIFLANIFIH